jgi:hypothetical protein
MTRSRSARVAIALALAMFVGVSVATLAGQAQQTPPCRVRPRTPRHDRALISRPRAVLVPLRLDPFVGLESRPRLTRLWSPNSVPFWISTV